MSITVEAVYENGVLKPAKALPLKEHARVQVTIEESPDVPQAGEAARRGYGMLRWTGSVEDLDYLINDAENDPLEGS